MVEISFNNPYQLSHKQKQEYLLNQLTSLTDFHEKQCELYQNIVKNLPFKQGYRGLEDIPYLPVQLFKMLELYSVPKSEIIKTLMSSGTTSQLVSQIFIDRDTSLLQSKALIAIVTNYIGKKRLPMIIVDKKNVIKDRKAFNARGAGIVGFSSFGRDHFYLLEDDMSIDWGGLKSFLDKHQGNKILFFGFTFMIWKYFYKICQEENYSLKLQDSILIHGGGWKKLQEEAVSNNAFKSALYHQFGIPNVYNYYGMVEQVGSIFMECEQGHLHTPDFADILIRDTESLETLPIGKKGIIQVFSVLPKSYPGHSLLTEDIGVILGEDDCPCGRNGRYFAVEGRLPKSELRGCSDTHAYEKKVVVR
jgi:phenylacetate-coenzyme A ligase PaaK-like adenylate-forming protein